MTDRAILAERFRKAAAGWKGSWLQEVDVHVEVGDLQAIADLLEAKGTADAVREQLARDLEYNAQFGTMPPDRRKLLSDAAAALRSLPAVTGGEPDRVVTEAITGYPDEGLLPDDYPIYGNFLYVADGKVVMSDWHGITAREFKHRENYRELRRCNIEARRKALALTRPQRGTEA